MTTPNPQTDEIRAGALSSENVSPGSARPSHGSDPAVSVKPIADKWMGAASFVLGGVIAFGFLLVLFGAYLTPNDLLILIGAGIMTLAATGWAVVAILMIGSIVRRWCFDIFGKANKGTPPTSLE